MATEQTFLEPRVRSVRTPDRTPRAAKSCVRRGFCILKAFLVKGASLEKENSINWKTLWESGLEREGWGARSVRSRML
jgi:hypothetical protein